MTLLIDDATAAEFELRRSEAFPGEWRAGRLDAVSYTGDGEGPFKNVYADDPNGKVHMGEVLPAIVAAGFGDEDKCRANAVCLALAVNALPKLLTDRRTLLARIAELEKERDAMWAALEKIAEEPIRSVIMHRVREQLSEIEKADEPGDFTKGNY